MQDRVGSASALGVLLLCFGGAKRAAHIRRPLSRELEQQGSAVLDTAIIRVDGQGKVRVYDPQRTMAGALTAALTWGVFGALSSGLIGPIGWAVIGAVCGGLFAYYREQPLSGTQLRRIGEGMRPDSSAIVVFMKSAEEALPPATAAHEPTTATLAAVSGDLSARVLAGAGGATDVTAVPGGQPPGAEKGTDRDTLLNMLLVRLPGQHTDREALPKLAATGKTPDLILPQVEVVLESDAQGGLHAGALYGLFAGNVLSARQLKKLHGLVPPDTSLAFLWADGDLTHEAIDRWAPPESQRTVVRFNTTSKGITLSV